MTPDLVSVVVPSYNHAKYIVQLLESLKAQTYKKFEVIVVDDGSTDGSPELLKSRQKDFDYKLVLKSNEGLCSTLNRGLKEVTGEFVVIIASDDFMPPGRLEEQVELIKKGGYDVIAGGMTEVNEKGESLGYVRPLREGSITFEDLLQKNLLSAPTAMIRADVFQRFGVYNPEFLVEDYYMWLKVAKAGGRIAAFDKDWVFYRKIAGSSRKKVDWYYEGLFQVLEQYPGEAAARASLARARFNYVAKIAILDGPSALNHKRFGEISFVKKQAVKAVAFAPLFIRKFLARKLFAMNI